MSPTDDEMPCVLPSVMSLVICSDILVLSSITSTQLAETLLSYSTRKGGNNSFGFADLLMYRDIIAKIDKNAIYFTKL